MTSLRPLRANDPRQVGGFALQGRLGEGGQGTVYLGVGADGERAAVKVLHRSPDEDPAMRRQFEREMTAVRRVAPFCTARILAADPGGDPPYVVSEYIDGPSLREAVERGGVLAGTDLDRLAIATATALAAIHEAGVVHRDFKPGNVLLGQDGPRVIDFGVARPMDASTATASGAVGTPAYMAPEQLAGASAGTAMDMFAWACTIAYAANGVPPFGHSSLPSVINRILNDAPDLGALRGPLRDLVAACLAKDPALRPTARQVLTTLLGDADRTVADSPAGLLEAGMTAARGPWTAVPPPSSPPSPMPDGPYRQPTVPRRPGERNRLLPVAAAVLAVLVLAAAAFGGALWWNGRDRAQAGSEGADPSQSAGPASQGTRLLRSPRIGLEIWQNGALAPMDFADRDLPSVRVTMRRAPFELRFPKPPADVPVRICAWTDSSVFDLEDGADVTPHTCMGAGRGLADTAFGSATLYLNNEGHNHLVGDRVATHSAQQDKVLFSVLHQEGREIPLADFEGTLYLTVFIDKNADGRFNAVRPRAEYEYLILTL
ncbi:serine/threonine protein kinase [Thermomonospora cellulosilytica]|uniref:Protein kinase domain-containing protein n=1 Tax=Thermomonospora cellulosilytica TaxID=1411118 RepID=A0A7W3MTT7_9ACTN|nr:serine/threonine-protein kinase [Thermomonospora cellulosilytica]MBA9001782.1 hypothetical protein [Thermomonospora cellulosilytica]